MTAFRDEFSRVRDDKALCKWILRDDLAVVAETCYQEGGRYRDRFVTFSQDNSREGYDARNLL